MKRTFVKPFKLAELAIRAYPHDAPWEEKEDADEDEFRQAVKRVLDDPRDSGEILFDKRFEHERHGIELGKKIQVSTAFRKDGTIDRRVLQAWYDEKSSIPVAEFSGEEAREIEGVLTEAFGISDDSPPYDRKYKNRLLSRAFDESETTFATYLANRAMERALSGLQNADKGEIHVSVNIEKDEAFYSCILPPQDPLWKKMPDFRQRAIVELGKLKKELAAFFEPMKDGYFLLPERMEKQFPFLLQGIIRTLNTHFPKAQAMRQRIQIDGKELSPEELKRMQLLEAIRSDGVQKFLQGMNPEEAKSLRRIIGVQSEEELKAAWGQAGFDHIHNLRAAEEDGRHVNCIEITDPGQVAWLEHSLGLGGRPHD